MKFQEIFLCRQKLHSILCDFLEKNGIRRAFLPIISKTVTNESYTDVFRATSCEDERQWYYMHPSPEFQIKKLMVKENKPFYYLGSVFRSGEPEASPLHTPEFEMLEWYQFNISYEEFIENTKNMIQTAVSEFDLPCFLSDEFFETTWSELFVETAGVELEVLRDFCATNRGTQIRGYIQEHDDFSTAFHKIYYNEIYDSTKDGKLWVIKDFPIEQSALAKEKSGKLAERFEIYWNGVELVNGYNEENSSEKMEKILQKNSKERLQLKKHNIGIDKEFLLAIEKLPASMCGASLGVDRFLYLLLSKNAEIKSIKDIIFSNF